MLDFIIVRWEKEKNQKKRAVPRISHITLRVLPSLPITTALSSNANAPQTHIYRPKAVRRGSGRAPLLLRRPPPLLASYKQSSESRRPNTFPAQIRD